MDKSPSPCDAGPYVLARYRIVRGRRPPDDPLPEGVRLDIRKHTRHILAPDAEAVERYLAGPTEEAWRRFEAAYLERITRRFVEDPAPFIELAERARSVDVFLGCSCPTAKNPDVEHCHTTLALAFMQERFPDLPVHMP